MNKIPSVRDVLTFLGAGLSRLWPLARPELVEGPLASSFAFSIWE